MWSFYPKYAWDSIYKYSVFVRSWLKLDAAVRRIRKDPNRLLYTDQALTEVTEDETELLELFTHSNDARHAVEHERKIARLTGGQSRSLEPDKVL
jgi:hypothetical protein